MFKISLANGGRLDKMLSIDIKVLGISGTPTSNGSHDTGVKEAATFAGVETDFIS